MQKEKSTSPLPKFPTKEIKFHGKPVTFKKIDNVFDRSGIFLSHPWKKVEKTDKPLAFQKYPSIYSTKLSGGFVYLWDVLREEYVENLGLINYDQFSLYNYMASLRNSGWHVSIKGRPGKLKKGADGKLMDEREADVKGLAQIAGRRWTSVLHDLDVLEDALLIHRIRRPDFHGCPSEIVIHTPFAAQELVQVDRETGERTELESAHVLRQRIEDKITANRRLKIVKHGIKKESAKKFTHFSWHDRRQEDDRFVFDFRKVVAAFGDKVDQFAWWAMEFFQEHWNLLYSDRAAFQEDYRRELHDELTRWKILDNSDREECYKQANKFRTIYCPTEQEICGA